MTTSRKLTIIESPLSSANGRTMDQNLTYLRACLRDSWNRGELPFASHGFFPFFLNEHDTAERQQGIEAGYLFWNFVTLTAQERTPNGQKFYSEVPTIAFYIDHNISIGMRAAHKRAIAYGYKIEFRNILSQTDHEGDSPNATK